MISINKKESDRNKKDFIRALFMDKLDVRFCKDRSAFKSCVLCFSAGIHVVCADDLICLMLARHSTCFCIEKNAFLPSGQSPRIFAVSV